MATKAKSHLPEGLRTVTPHLVLPNALEAIEFYKKAFGAELRFHHPGPAPKSTMHAEIRISDSAIFLADDMQMGGPLKPPSKLGGNGTALTLFVPDADAVFQKSVAAGAKVLMPIDNQFWGDRYGQVQDPFGHVWSIATHKEDLTPEELGARTQEAFAKMMPPK